LAEDTQSAAQVRKDIFYKARHDLDKIKEEFLPPPEAVAVVKRFIGLCEQYVTENMVMENPGLLMGLTQATSTVAGQMLGALTGFHRARSYHPKESK
jgi:hypothetical protein